MEHESPDDIESLRAQVAEEERVALQMAVAAGKADARVAFLQAQLAALEEDSGRELARLRTTLEVVQREAGELDGVSGHDALASLRYIGHTVSKALSSTSAAPQEQSMEDALIDNAEQFLDAMAGDDTPAAPDAWQPIFGMMEEADDALDKDVYEQKRATEFDAPADAEWTVRVGTVRKIEKVFAAIERLRPKTAPPREALKP